MKYFITARLNARIADSEDMAKAVHKAIKQFDWQDWGLVPDEDKAANDADLKARQGHVLARYNTPEGDIYINLEFGEDYTKDNACIMFTDEY